MKVRVDSGLPIPKMAHRGAGKGYPWTELQVGDSFWIRGARMSSMSQMARKYLGVGSYAARSIDGGIRVWRTK